MSFQTWNLSKIYECGLCDCNCETDDDLEAHLEGVHKQSNDLTENESCEISSDSEWQEDDEHYDVDENVENLDLHPIRCQKCIKILEDHDEW